MSGESAFKVEGLILEALPNRTYRVELPNGHEVRAFVAGRKRPGAEQYAPGDRVKLQMSPYDLSQGRIVTEQKKI